MKNITIIMKFLSLMFGFFDSKKKSICTTTLFQEMKTIRTFCATLVLDNSGTELVTRISNRVYTMCRANDMNVPGFPDYGPTIDALKQGSTPTAPRSYKVCIQQADRLKVLESYAEKWVSTPSTVDRATELIEAHNSTYNPDAEWWVADKNLISTNHTPTIWSWGITYSNSYFPFPSQHLFPQGAGLQKVKIDLSSGSRLNLATKQPRRRSPAWPTRD